MATSRKCHVLLLDNLDSPGWGRNGRPPFKDRQLITFFRPNDRFCVVSTGLQDVVKASIIPDVVKSVAASSDSSTVAASSSSKVCYQSSLHVMVLGLRFKHRGAVRTELHFSPAGTGRIYITRISLQFFTQGCKPTCNRMRSRHSHNGLKQVGGIFRSTCEERSGSAAYNYQWCRCSSSSGFFCVP